MAKRTKRIPSPPPSTQANVVVYGESGVGKTRFLDMFIQHGHWEVYDPIHHESARKIFTVDNHTWFLEMLDISSTIFRSSSSPLMPDANNIYNVDLNTWIKNAQGVVLLFDITSRSSYDLLTENGYMHVIFQRATTYPGGLPYLAGQERFGGVLVGTKVDLTARPATASDRKVSRQEAEDWAQIQGMKYFEVDTRHLEPVEEAMRALVRSIIRAKRRDGEDLKEVKERFKRMDKEERAKRMSVSSLGGAIRRAFGKRS